MIALLVLAPRQGHEITTRLVNSPIDDAWLVGTCRRVLLCLCGSKAPNLECFITSFLSFGCALLSSSISVNMEDQANGGKRNSGAIHRATLSDPNPNETFARYQSAPFRQFSSRNFQDAAFHDVTPILNNGKGAALQNDLADHQAVQEVLERQKKLEDSLQRVVDGQSSQNARGGAGSGHLQDYDAVDFDPSAGQSNVGGQTKRPEYSLAGPRGPPPTDQYKAYRDLDYRNFGEEEDSSSQPKWGLAKPFPHVSRKGRRGRKTKQSGATRGSRREHPTGQV